MTSPQIFERMPAFFEAYGVKVEIGKKDEGSMPRAIIRLPLFAVLVLLSLCSPLGFGGCSKEAPPPPKRSTPQVTAVTIAQHTIPYTWTFVAQTESSRQVDIVARVSGFLDLIAYEEGELVTEGQLLFRLDPRPFQAQLDAANGALQAQEARHRTAIANLNRVKPLAQQNALPLADLDRAQGEFDASRAAVFQARAKVKEAALNLGYATIRSPLTGLASRSLQREGAFINSTAESARLTYVAALDPIWVNFSVSQNQVARTMGLVQKDQFVPPKNESYDVELVLSTGTSYPYKGRIDFADPSFSQNTGAFLVRAELPNPERELRPGMFVTVKLHGAVRPNAIVVPQLAVQQGSKGHLVYVVNGSGVAEVRPVIVGDYHGQKDIVVVSGLHTGDRVVVDGVLKVVPGQPVRIVESADAGAPPTGDNGGPTGAGHPESK